MHRTGSRPRNQRVRARWAAAIVAATALVSTGCSGDGSTSQGSDEQVRRPSAQLVDYAAVSDEYATTLARLQLPEGAAKAPGVPKQADATMYEKGFGVGLAERYWICSWERQWLEVQAADPAAGESALAQLRKAPETVFMSQQLDEAGRRLYREYLTKAGLGDPSGFQQDVDQNCGP